MNRKLTILAVVMLLVIVLLLAAMLSACGGGKNQLETARGLINESAETLIEKIGEPNDSRYAQSCLGDGEDGELYYDGFTVYTYRDTDGVETIYDVMEQN